MGRLGVMARMPRYFFDSTDGRVIHRDFGGIEVANDEEAKRAALRALADLSQESIPTAGHQHQLKMWVRDEHGRELIALVIGLSVRPLH